MTSTRPPDSSALDALAADAWRHLAFIGEDAQPWLTPPAGVDHNIVVVGGGQSGLAIAFALRRAGIGGVTVIDAAAEGEEGVWRHPARMSVLRTPKVPPGPEIGLPALSFQAWYEAAHGVEAYAALPHVPRTVWADYVDWFRRAARIPVRNGARLVRVEPRDGLLAVHLDDNGRAVVETARKLVLATGITGSGGPFIPDVIRESLPAHLYAHTHDAIDFARLKGKTVAVLGSAASAFDAAGTALEAGARSVELFSRGAGLARSSAMKPFNFFGAWEHFHALPDAQRWAVMRHFRRRASFPPLPAVKRATAFDAFRIHLDAGWSRVLPHAGGVRITTVRGSVHDADFVIAGTGYHSDARLEPAFGAFAGAIARWSDRVPLGGTEDEALARAPYLGPGFALVERVKGEAPFLADIHFVGFSAQTSTGRPVGDVASLRHNVPRLVSAIGRDLFVRDGAAYVERFLSPAAPDLPEEAYAGAMAQGALAEAAV